MLDHSHDIQATRLRAVFGENLRVSETTRADG
jgi:hypothetical protein